ncbi:MULTISPECIES: DUF481 domain-containing protein [unclassified Polaribacter]|uniref:DUF481 domain-containing protein n=1 Tax=unclassified Polaribacter TaxID=196858 RepID=UPI0011BEFE28|nr:MULTISPECIES: DUF481 domain-containing protein [unclassified Polaribacter]TXD54013.1 DUF481 domain-containing protein [Polaribacter sp. IC063]TXD62529.1 DUF481 domain-containing protein [Polaribacter sp. IC066]
MKNILFCFLFLPIFISAQINESDTLKFKAKISLTGFWQGGNVETLIFRAKSDVSFKPAEKWVFKTINSYVYQAFGKVKADEDILSLNFLYFNPNRKIYPLLLSFVSTNFRREIDLRSLVGVGVTYQVLENKEYWLKFSVSSEYEQTKFASAKFNLTEYNGNQSINTFRSTFWVNGKYNLFKKKVLINHEIYFQPSLEQSNNFRWQADLGLELPVWKFLNFKINYLHTFESIVIESQKQEDGMLSFGFTLKSF